MKDFIYRPAFIRSLEFWTATSIVIAALFFRISGVLSGTTAGIPFIQGTGGAAIPAQYYRLQFFPQLLQYLAFYGAFMLLNFIVVPRIIAKRALATNIVLGFVVMTTLGLILATLDTYLRSGTLGSYPNLRGAHQAIFRERALYMIWLTILYAGYAAAIAGCTHLLRNLERLQTRYAFLSAGPILAIAAWFIGLFFMLVVMRQPALIVCWAIFPPSSIVIYVLAKSVLIPKSLGRRKPFRNYLLKSFLITAAAFLPIGAVATLICGQPEIGFPASVFNSLFQFLIATPVSWVVYMRMRKGLDEVQELREKLGQSKAHLDFLRSQINPHFLFNALNTIYGTALEEKAERTSEGVHRLGEMMRFMLQENTQEQIPLAREIEYLNNYLALQRLRTDVHPNIEIRTEIPAELSLARIAPMLLIPFVENAFKHGISFRRPSYIRVAMELRDSVLNFDIHNSRHSRSEDDPEANSSGIGLSNVKQRLELIYPGRHELMIRETGREFFVHLTIQLTDSPMKTEPPADADAAARLETLPM
jgi:two-component system LytT family sensor kinase